MSKAQNLLESFGVLDKKVNNNELDEAIDAMNKIAGTLGTHNICCYLQKNISMSTISEFANLITDGQFSPRNNSSYLAVMPNTYMVDFLSDAIIDTDNKYKVATWDGFKITGPHNPELIITDEKAHSKLYTKTDRDIDSVIVFKCPNEVQRLQNMAQNREIGLEKFVPIN